LLSLSTVVIGAASRPRIRDSAAILSANCPPSRGDCVAEVKYAIRTTRGSDLAKALDEQKLIVRVIISGRGADEEIVAKPPSVKVVRPTVFIDVGLPPMERHEAVTAETNPLPDEVKKWVRSIALARPDWEYRFIAGDERVCKISGVISARGLAQNPDQAWDKVGELPYERLDEMAEIFRREPRLLVVVAKTPPIWLPREATEWMTYGNLDVAERRRRGHEQQARVARHEVDADELDFFAEDGFVLLATGVESPGEVPAKTAKTEVKDDPVTVDRMRVREALRKGVRDLTKADTALLDAMTFLKRVDALDIIEYRGEAKVSLSGIARPTSGAYQVEVQLQRGATNVIATNESAILEPAVPNWARATLLVLTWISAAIGFIAVVLVFLVTWKKRAKPDPDFAEVARNALFAIAGVLIGISVTIALEADSISMRNYAIVTATVGAGILAFAAGYWILRYAKA
jgi:hypothetical protein